MDKRIEEKMKTVSIVYNQPLTQIQGINYVNNSFVKGGKYFKEYGFLLDRIYAPDGIFDCTTHDHLDLIGSNIGTAAYQRERRLRILLREILSSKYLLGASIKMFFNFTLNARKAVRRIGSNHSDFFIFQDLDSVREYYKRYGRKKDVKTVVILHCSNHPLEQFVTVFPGYFKYRWLKNKTYRRCKEAMMMADKVIYLSKRAMDKSFLPLEKKTYIFNGIEDIENVVVMPPSKPLQLVCVASVTYHKGQLNIVESLSMLDHETLSKIHLTIVGGGNELEECIKMVKDKGLEKVVTVTGPRNDVAKILVGMDVFILPSISEGMPMSILEAMRQGLYIMATEVGGIPEMIGEGYGEFISREPRELADAITRVVTEKVVTQESKQISRKRFETDFTLKKMVGKYSQALLSI